MDLIKAFSRNNKRFIYAGVIWTALWMVPWGNALVVENNLYLIFSLDMLKLGLALGIFILPGALLFMIFQDDDETRHIEWSVLPFGFALSVAIIGMIGILGRVLGLSFESVKYTFGFIGLAELLFLAVYKPNFWLLKLQFTERLRDVVGNTPLLLALILATSITLGGYQFFIDDTTYAAYVMNWQHSVDLGFSNIVHHFDRVEELRFWLALYPMGQALLTNISGVPAILLFSNYLELLLVPLAVITSYYFARSLELSQKESGLSVLIQVIFYIMMIDESWPVGFWFFQNMAEDKVTAVFLLAPVFFSFVLKYLKYPTKIKLLFVFLCGIGLMLTHPVILFLACAIAVGLIFFSRLIMKTDWQIVLKVMLVIGTTLLPYFVLRLYVRYSQLIPFNGESASTTFQVERYINFVNNTFYGLNPNVLKLLDIPLPADFYPVYQIIRFLPFIVVLCATIFSLSRLPKGSLHWYIATCTLLIVFATVPYTGWMLGYAISARMLPRVSWFLPLGLSGILLVRLFPARTNRGKEKPTIPTESGNATAQQIVKGVLTGLVFAGIMLNFFVLPRGPIFLELLNHNNQLAQLGRYIDQHTTAVTTVIALDYVDVQMIPAISAHASLISFREETAYNPHNYFLSVEEIKQRMDASNAIRSLSPSTPTEERCHFLTLYNVRYVLARTDHSAEYMKLTDVCEKKFTNVFQTDDLVLLEYR